MLLTCANITTAMAQVKFVTVNEAGEEIEVSHDDVGVDEQVGILSARCDQNH